MPPPVVVHPRGVVERHDWSVRRRRVRAEVSRVFVSSRSRLDFYARSASEAGEADVRPKRGEPIGHSCKRRWSEKRASDGRARPETGASTAHDRLDRVPVPWTPCMFAVRHVFDARSDFLPRKTRPPRPSEPRGASRVSALPASATNAARRGPRARRAVRRDVPCVPRPSTQPEPVPFESPASSLRADGVRRVAFWRLRRARLTRAQATFLKAKERPEKTESGKSDPRSGVRAAAESVISNASHGRIKIAISARSSSHRSPRVFSHANEKSRVRRILESRTQDDSNSENR